MSLIGLITLLTLVSCGGGGSAEDDLTAPPVVAANEEDMVPITFSGSEGNEATVTRASGTPLSDKDITRFHVWGYKNTAVDYSTYQTVFPGYQVDWQANSAATTTTNTNNWDYIGTVANQYIKYWDWSAKAYRFYAVTGEAASDAADLAANPEKYLPNGTSTSFTFQIDATSTTEMDKTPYFSHLWFSNGSTEPSSPYYDKQFGKPVTLEFLKPYARVRFLFTYVYPREGIKLEDITFKPSDGSKIVRKGTFTIIYPLTGTKTQEWFEMTPDAGGSGALDAFEVDYDPEDDTKVYPADCPGGWYNVLANNTQGSYTLSAKVSGANKTAVVPADYMQWLPGYSYTYIFKITEEGGIEIGWVEYAMTPWTEQLGTWTVYNW